MCRQLLFWLTTACALALAGLVFIAPWLTGTDPRQVSRWLALFAGDVVVRRTSLACALGLFVTALSFFRKSPSDNPANKPNRDTKPPRRPRSGNTVGA